MRTLAILLLALLIGCATDDNPAANAPNTPPPLPTLDGNWTGVSRDGHDTLRIAVVSTNTGIDIVTTGGTLLPPNMTVSGVVRQDSTISISHDPYSTGDPNTGIVFTFGGKLTSGYAFNGLLRLSINWAELYYSQMFYFTK